MYGQEKRLQAFVAAEEVAAPPSRRTPPSRRPQRAQSMIVPRGEGPANEESLPRPALDMSFSSALVAALVELGVDQAFGIFGGGIAPFSKALAESSVRLLHFRHEAGAAFAAIESSLQSGKLTVVLATTGPGLTNLYTGMVAARAEGAKVLFVSGGTAAAQRGRAAFQETSAYGSAVSPLFSAGTLFHYAAMVETPAELEAVVSRLRTGVARPDGFVAHLGLPMPTQSGRVKNLSASRVTSSAPPVCDAGTIARCAELLSSGPFVIWTGFGARNSAKSVRKLARLTGARVMSSPRGKGIVRETDPQYLGVTGLGGHARVEAYFDEARPERVLVLGSKLGEMTSFWSPKLVPSRGFVHVDLDSQVFGAAYPNAETLGVQSEIGAFVDALIEAWPEREAKVSKASPLTRLSARPRAPRPESRVRPSYLMDRIQRLIVEASDAPVLTEAGNAFAFGSHYLYFTDPKRYRVSTSFGSMGQAAAGVLGAALSRAGKAVAILGDGAMLMQNEINTAATYGIDAVWIVLNDARYGMIEQGMKSIGWQPFETSFSRADFVEIARGMGGAGVRVETEGDVDRALALAMRVKGPFVVDVWIDESEMAPAIGRNQSLMQQGVNASPSSSGVEKP